MFGAWRFIAKWKAGSIKDGSTDGFFFLDGSLVGSVWINAAWIIPLSNYASGRGAALLVEKYNNYF